MNQIQRGAENPLYLILRCHQLIAARSKILEVYWPDWHSELSTVRKLLVGGLYTKESQRLRSSLECRYDDSKGSSAYGMLFLLVVVVIPSELNFLSFFIMNLFIGRVRLKHYKIKFQIHDFLINRFRINLRVRHAT